MHSLIGDCDWEEREGCQWCVLSLETVIEKRGEVVSGVFSHWRLGFRRVGGHVWYVHSLGTGIGGSG